MNVLLIGSGGREHALAWGLKKSRALRKLFIAPGNAGTATLGENAAIPATDIFRLRCFAQEQKIDLTFVGPEDPIALGIRDLFEQVGLKIIAPEKRVTFLEASKVRAKEFMQKHKIPTAKHRSFSDHASAAAYAKSRRCPLVIKADGLAAGKGVAIAGRLEEADEILRAYLIERRFGPASQSVVVEEFLCGRELSVFAAADGQSYRLLGAAQDYKRLLDGDRGPNTGGMGAISPVPWLTDAMLDEITRKIIDPTFAALRTEGLAFEGLLYFGLIWTESGPYVIEYNVRLGDPETQVLVPRFDFDLLELFAAIAEGELDAFTVQWKPLTAVCVVAASGGYPESSEKGVPITLESAESQPESQLLFHAGTERRGEGIVTAGGRVLNAIGLGTDADTARRQAYALLERISFSGMHFRKDIAIG